MGPRPSHSRPMTRAGPEFIATQAATTTKTYIILKLELLIIGFVVSIYFNTLKIEFDLYCEIAVKGKSY